MRNGSSQRRARRFRARRHRDGYNLLLPRRLQKRIFLEADWRELELKTLAEVLRRGGENIDSNINCTEGKEYSVTGRLIQKPDIVLMPVFEFAERDLK